MNKDTPDYPYLPEGKTFTYVPEGNKFMRIARDFCEQNSLDKAVPTGSAIVKDGRIIGLGANGSTYHEAHICERIRQNIPTGQGYELCEGCHPKNHSEPKAIQNALQQGRVTQGAELYLWGHWWCCESCWTTILKVGIERVYLLENSQILFNKLHPENILPNIT